MVSVLEGGRVDVSCTGVLDGSSVGINVDVGVNVGEIEVLEGAMVCTAVVKVIVGLMFTL